MLKIKSRAKINLSLDVIGKRDNGYHEVDMIMQEIDLYDKLIFKKNDGGIEVECNNPNIPIDSRNIVYQAVLKLNEYLNKDLGICIKIDKKIPISAGLGGGSSNAATTIKACNQLFDLKLSKIEMKKIGKKLGADVPFFFEGGCCRAEGIGEILTPIKGLENGWILLCKPNIGVSTEDIYRELNYPLISSHPDVDGMVKALDKDDLIEISNKLGNVLQRVTLNKHNVVKQVKEKMENSNSLGVLMSGSGPTIFGIFKTYSDGKKNYKKLKSIYSETYLIKSFNGGKNVKSN